MFYKSGPIFRLIALLFVAVYVPFKRPLSSCVVCMALAMHVCAVDNYFTFDWLIRESNGLKRQLFAVLFCCVVWGMTNAKCNVVSNIRLTLMAVVFCGCYLPFCRSLDRACCVSHIVSESGATTATAAAARRPGRCWGRRRSISWRAAAGAFWAGGVVPGVAARAGRCCPCCRLRWDRLFALLVPDPRLHTYYLTLSILRLGEINDRYAT